jgi:hypothetical protein
MGEAVNTNFERWPILGTWVWPNYYVGETYSDEEWFLRNWIDERLEWLDARWGGQCWALSDESEQAIPLPDATRIYPNPSDLSATFVDLNGFVEAELPFSLYDMNGRVVHKGLARYSGSEFTYALPDLSYLGNGLYTLEIESPAKESVLLKLIKL